MDVSFTEALYVMKEKTEYTYY